MTVAYIGVICFIPFASFLQKFLKNFLQIFRVGSLSRLAFPFPISPEWEVIMVMSLVACGSSALGDVGLTDAKGCMFHTCLMALMSAYQASFPCAHGLH